LDDGVLADEAVIAEHRSLLEPCSAPDPPRVADDAAAQLGAGADEDVVVQDAALHPGVRADPDAGAEDGVGADHGTGCHPARRADQRRSPHGRGGVDLGSLAEPHAVADREAGDVRVDPPVEQVPVDPQVGLEGADVLPVPVAHARVDAPPLLQQAREDLLGEVHGSPFGDGVEDRRVHHVDAGVDRVAEHPAPGRFLEEPLDGAAGADDDDPEVQRVVPVADGDGHLGGVVAVPAGDPAQVGVGDHVTGDDEELLVGAGHGRAHRAGRAERRVLHRPTEPDPELGAVAEVVA
jgi:hypothetical protein